LVPREDEEEPLMSCRTASNPSSSTIAVLGCSSSSALLNQSSVSIGFGWVGVIVTLVLTEGLRDVGVDDCWVGGVAVGGTTLTG